VGNFTDRKEGPPANPAERGRPNCENDRRSVGAVSVVIEGVKVDNPTGVWMQLMNTRRRVLDRVEKWNDKGWYSGDAFRPTMCLANALRYVARGERGQPAAFSREQGDLEQAERVVMKAIVKVAHATYDDIPDFNDATYRQFDQIVRVLDEAIEMVAPYAKTFAISYADDVMTPEEKQEIQAAVRKAENEMWAEDRKRWGKHRDPNGIWRRADGRFASVPWWVRHGKETVTTTVPATWVPPKTTVQAVVGRARAPWLGHVLGRVARVRQGRPELRGVPKRQEDARPRGQDARRPARCQVR
jgi:hypothetical protein